MATDNTPAADLTEVGTASDYVDDPIFGKQPKDVATQIKLQEKARLAEGKLADSKDKATEAASKAAQDL